MFLPKKGKEAAKPKPNEKKATNETKAAAPKKAETGMTRRDFLRKTGVAAGAVALATSGIPEKLYAQEQPKSDKEKEILKKCWDLPNKIYDFLEKEGIQLNTSLTIEERKISREKFLKEFPLEKLEESLDYIYSNNHFFYKDNGLGSIMGATLGFLERLGCQGIIYNFAINKIKQDNRLEKEKIIEKLSSHPYYYGSMSQDYLPEAADITANQIDPRLNGFKRSIPKLDASNMYITDLGFAGEERQAQFKEILSNKIIRERIKTENITLAEACSIAKAIIHYREQQYKLKQSDEDIFEVIMSKQRDFKKKVILGKGFNLINFNFFDKESSNSFSNKGLKQLALALGIKEDDMTIIEGVKTADEISLMLKTAIVNCEGPTAIYFNTHGSELGLALTEEEKNLSFEFIAQALLRRLVLRKSANDLGDINIIIDACYGHNFAKSLLSSMHKQYIYAKIFQDENGGEKTAADILKKDFSGIGLPTIITAAQESSQSYTTPYDIDHSFLRNFEALKKEGALTGEYLLQRIQPEVYVNEDMTIFFPQPENKKLEIGLKSIQEDTVNYISV